MTGLILSCGTIRVVSEDILSRHKCNPTPGAFLGSGFGENSPCFLSVSSDLQQCWRC